MACGVLPGRTVGGHLNAGRRDMTGAGDRRRIVRRTPAVDDAAVERVLQRIGDLSEFTREQIRQIAVIALVAVSADEVDRQRRDETARENRRRLRGWGRD
jgi:hypothetical protein